MYIRMYLCFFIVCTDRGGKELGGLRDANSSETVRGGETIITKNVPISFINAYI